MRVPLRPFARSTPSRDELGTNEPTARGERGGQQVFLRKSELCVVRVADQPPVVSFAKCDVHQPVQW